MRKEARQLFPDLADLAEREARRLEGLAMELRRAELVERSSALLDVLGAISERYEADKRARALLDFDDLIEHAVTLFEDRALGDWVRYKLDARSPTFSSTRARTPTPSSGRPWMRWPTSSSPDRVRSSARGPVRRR